MTGEPFPLFREMRRVRARIYRLLDGILRPADQADLYFLLGCLSDLMAVAASGLGYPQAAEELIVVYVGHPGVRRDLPGNLVHIPGGRDAGADVDDLPDARLADQEPHGPLLGRPYANCLHSQS